MEIVIKFEIKHSFYGPWRYVLIANDLLKRT